MGIDRPDEGTRPHEIEFSCGGIRCSAWLDSWGPGWPETYWPRVAEIAADKTLLVLWGGNAHNWHFLLAPEPLFDFILDDEEANAELVPKALVKELFRHQYDKLPAVLQLLKSRGAHVVMLGTPAPKSDPEFLAQLIAKNGEVYLKHQIPQGDLKLEQIHISPLWLRYKMWRVLQDMTREQALAANIEFIPVPEASLDGMGLRREYWADDCTHANRAYGALAIRHALDKLNEPSVQTSS